MFTSGVAITLLYIACVLVHCTHQNNNAVSNGAFIRKCRFDNVDGINDHQSRCNFKNTLTITLHDMLGNGNVSGTRPVVWPVSEANLLSSFQCFPLTRTRVNIQ
ncbi:uncharacterized protein LOC105681186 [Bombus impatiens]|uniref:Uncharacterized protein LOC105681186 n=1 Tax=Bombus impatiens TaxID=132113 RepID=A0A6P3UZL3_BOMIM|nr:uncharacterized protein LOC105681186 [Bombus impatiens]